MIEQELIDKIIEKYRAGERRDMIIQELTEEGWHESEIRAAIREIQKNALQKLPFVGALVNYLRHWEHKTASLSTRWVIGLSAAMVVVVVLIAVILYNSLDPLNEQGVARDKIRTKDLAALQQAITNYHANNHIYPTKLEELVPSAIASLPTDPKTHQNYEYRIIDDLGNYELCVYFEAASANCVSSTTSSQVPTVFPTPTSMPVYNPQTNGSQVVVTLTPIPSR